MEEPILVVGGNKAQRRELCAVLEREHFLITVLDSLADLEKSIPGGPWRVVILDLDTLPVHNRLFRDLKRLNPALHIIGLSSRPFHPELKEAVSFHIYACIGKPVDPDELLYWLNSIGRNDST